MKTDFPSFVLFGDSHGFYKDFEEIKKLVVEFKPEFILWEQLQDKHLISEWDFVTYLKKNLNDDFRNLVYYCKEKHIPMFGIDIENFGLDKNMQLILEGKRECTPQEEKEIGEIVKKRESLHLEKVNYFMKHAKKTVLVIVGAWHLREGSLLREKLSNYVVIYPCNEEGKAILEPQELRKVSYSRETVK